MRCLPPNLSEEIFWQSVQTWVMDDSITWTAYHAKKLRKRANQEINVPSWAYIAFKNEEVLATFSHQYNGHLFRDKSVNTFSTLLRPLKVFNTVANKIANVHLYAKVALNIFTCTSKMILNQADHDDTVSSLLSKISEVYAFIMEKEEMTKIESMLTIYGKIAQQTLECADFISHYSEMKSTCMRLGKHIFNQTDSLSARWQIEYFYLTTSQIPSQLPHSPHFPSP
ncbi:hypothetical protein BD769DRAFT_1668187 [Suillus cothurnatus]|nr:hypothetical protein BD769DRAFT_1668187 [Suillus cothurnatus]